MKLTPLYGYKPQLSRRIRESELIFSRNLGILLSRMMVRGNEFGLGSKFLC